jgi:hypothetical protein
MDTKMMRTLPVIAVVLGLGSLNFVQPAQAGFEFMAPKAVSKPAPAPALPSQMVAPAYPSMAVPMAPVLSEPLSPIAPMNNSIIAPQAPINVPVVRPSGLVINPYPLGPETKRYNLADVSSGSVNRALVEQSGLVTPMPLGRNMRTGAQVENPPRPAVRKPDQQQMAAYNSGNISALTPIPGSPENVERQRLPMAGYEDAVGFGKDIPLSIALMQIVPEGYEARLSNTSLENSVISWEGGKPWNQVLNDVLRPLGYSASIQGSRVMIEPYLRG